MARAQYTRAVDYHGLATTAQLTQQQQKRRPQSLGSYRRVHVNPLHLILVVFRVPYREGSIFFLREMNPANHGQCHIRRNSRDERHEDLKAEVHQEDQTGVAREAAEQPPPRHGEERTPLLADQAHGHGSPLMSRAVVSQRATHRKPRVRSGSWSGVNESEDGVLILPLCARGSLPAPVACWSVTCCEIFNNHL